MIATTTSKTTRTPTVATAGNRNDCWEFGRTEVVVAVVNVVATVDVTVLLTMGVTVLVSLGFVVAAVGSLKNIHLRQQHKTTFWSYKGNV